MIWSVAAAFIATPLLAETTTDPVQNFRDTWDMEGVTRIFKLEADINNDGLSDIFLSTGKSDPPEADELGWQLYIAKTGGSYVIAPQKTDTGVNPSSIPGFKKEQYKIGFIPEINGHGLLHLSCGRGGQAKCQLKAIVIDGDAWKEILIGEPVNAEENYDQLAERFTDPPTPAVQELNP